METSAGKLQNDRFMPFTIYGPAYYLLRELGSFIVNMALACSRSEVKERLSV